MLSRARGWFCFPWTLFLCLSDFLLIFWGRRPIFGFGGGWGGGVGGGGLGGGGVWGGGGGGGGGGGLLVVPLNALLPCCLSASYRSFGATASARQKLVVVRLTLPSSPGSASLKNLWYQSPLLSFPFGLPPGLSLPSVPSASVFLESRRYFFFPHFFFVTCLSFGSWRRRLQRSKPFFSLTAPQHPEVAFDDQPHGSDFSCP